MVKMVILAKFTKERIVNLKVKLYRLIALSGYLYEYRDICRVYNIPLPIHLADYSASSDFAAGESWG